MDKKEQYERPYMEIIKFEVEDIITTSGKTDLPFVPSGELK